MPEKRKLKLAVCLFGHLRTYQKCAPYLRQNLLKRYDCDLFMHTWTTLDHNTKTWRDFKPKEGFTDQDGLIWTYGEFQGLEIEEQELKDLGLVNIQTAEDSRRQQRAIFGIGAMVHSMRESNRLRERHAKENEVQYDMVLCLRPDVVLKRPLEMEKFIKGLSKSEQSRAFFTVKSNTPKLISGFESLGGTDILFFAAPAVMSDVMEKAAQIIERFKPDMALRYGPEHEIIKFVQERLWTPYLIDYQIDRDWDILYHEPSVRRRLLQLRVRKNFIRLYLFQIYQRLIFRFRFAVLNWEFDLCLGAPTNKIYKMD